MLAALALMLASCGTPQRLPLNIPRCDAVRGPGGVSLTAEVQSKANKPITGLDLAVDFYRDFRYERVAAASKPFKEIDPGQEREVSFVISGAPAQVRGPAMRCFATRIAYQDGTFETVPSSQ